MTSPSLKISFNGMFISFVFAVHETAEVCIYTRISIHGFDGKDYHAKQND